MFCYLFLLLTKASQPSEMRIHEDDAVIKATGNWIHGAYKTSFPVSEYSISWKEVGLLQRKFSKPSGMYIFHHAVHYAEVIPVRGCDGVTPKSLPCILLSDGEMEVEVERKVEMEGEMEMKS